MARADLNKPKRISPVPKSAAVSKIMRSIKSKGTKPEIILRKALYSKGARGYRINYKKLPGSPDIAFLSKKIIIFVHGCFWHGCLVCGRRVPKHNFEYWQKKLDNNILRDTRRRVQLQNLGFNVIEIWEHEINNKLDETINRLLDLLSDAGSNKNAVK